MKNLILLLLLISCNSLFAQKVISLELPDPCTNLGSIYNPSDNANSDLLVFPNPSSSYMQIQLNSSLQPSSVDVYNMIGEKVKTIDKHEFITKSGRIDIQTLPSGFYVVRVRTSSSRTLTSKIIISHE